MKASEIVVLLLVLLCGIIALFFLFSYTGMAISTTYGYSQGEKGIVYSPTDDLQYPSIPEIRLLGTRFPGFIMLDSAGLYDIGKCRNDMIWKAHISSPKDRFSCYNTPLGQYVQPRPFDPWGRSSFKGNVFCYANPTGSEGQNIDSEAAVREKMLTVLVDNLETSWTSIQVQNSLGERIRVPVCA